MPWSTAPQTEIASAGDDELRMIPRWSMILAVALFIGMQYIFHGVLPHHKHEMLPMRVMMGYTWGALVASYALLLGYVSRDSKRRGMSPGLWMLVCVVLPGGIGAVVYFMLRQPILSRCPHCSTSLTASYNFCQQCQFQLAGSLAVERMCTRASCGV
jgi:hypothetical protein